MSVPNVLHFRMLVPNSDTVLYCDGILYARVESKGISFEGIGLLIIGSWMSKALVLCGGICLLMAC